MTNDELIKRVKEHAKTITIISYVELACAIPLLIQHFGFVLFVFAVSALMFQCRKLSDNISEFEDDLINENLHIAEDDLDEAGKSVYRISILSGLLIIATFSIFAMLLHNRPIFAYLILPALLYIAYVPICEDMEKAIKSLTLSLKMFRNEREGVHESYYL